MIPKETVDEILNVAQIEDIVGDFLTLKKRGANLLGLCPFHNEKTPSFVVSPAKGIYKCFGCGRAGNTVNFVMEHENLSYPDALRYLANKYNIEIVEEITQSPEAQAAASEKESLLIALKYAADYFAEQLLDSDEGKVVGLSYFKERGYREETVKKFQLGYAHKDWDAFTNAAIKAGYKKEYLEKAGLIKTSEQGKSFDMFRERVIFPIHNLSGRVIAFGARQLSKSDKGPKYLNSPETEVYHKSDVLYGMYYAKQAIKKNDVCYLVEGYTDVITLNQAGVENVVASSGTSLTEQQIKLIGRFTDNITVLFDGDNAGLKAALRGIDLILAGGKNVRIVVFPEGEDPDSYCKKLGGTAFEEFIAENEKDFILFKSGLLSEEAKGDPVKKTNAIRDIMESIGKIGDPIKRSFFIKECAKILEAEEQLLINEVNKMRRKAYREDEQSSLPPEEQHSGFAEEVVERTIKPPTDEKQEAAIIRLLVLHGNDEYEGTTVAAFIIGEIAADEIEFEVPLHKKIYEEAVRYYNENNELKDTYFLQHQDPEISAFVADVSTSKHHLSPVWANKHDIFIKSPDENYSKDLTSSLAYLRLKKVDRLVEDNQEKIKHAKTDEEIMDAQRMLIQLQAIRKELSDFLGMVVLK